MCRRMSKHEVCLNIELDLEAYLANDKTVTRNMTTLTGYDQNYDYID